MDEKYSEVPMHNNPVSFKVFTWTRWWQMQAEQGTTQGPGLYFCSTGLKQQFGKCRKQYESRRRLSLKFKKHGTAQNKRMNVPCV
jgi:hypothetical protein